MGLAVVWRLLRIDSASDLHHVLQTIQQEDANLAMQHFRFQVLEVLLKVSILRDKLLFARIIFQLNQFLLELGFVIIDCRIG